MQSPLTPYTQFSSMMLIKTEPGLTDIVDEMLDKGEFAIHL